MAMVLSVRWKIEGPLVVQYPPENLRNILQSNTEIVVLIFVQHRNSRKQFPIQRRN